MKRLSRVGSSFMNTVSPSLNNLGRSHSTDKFDKNHTFQGLSYLDVYEKYFQPLQKEPISILEIGVKDGASLRTWKDYFKKGRVYGLDIDPDCKHLEEERIRIEIGSQDDKVFLGKVFEDDPEFDIIIDDGSHVNSFTLASFDYLFYNRLKRGGIYIIEDLRCSYEALQTDQKVLETWPGMKYNDQNKSYDNDRKDMDTFFQQKIRDLDHLQGEILTIHFWAMTCVILKTPQSA